MGFKIGDRVVFKEFSYQVNNPKYGFSFDREYTIVSVEENSITGLYGIINNHKIKDYIYKRYIEFSPSEKRNKIIDEILD